MMPAKRFQNLLYKELSYQLQGAAIEVRKNFGPSHKETVYQQAFAEELKAKGLNFQKEKAIQVYSPKTGKVIGSYRPDFIVENKVIVEIKALAQAPRKLMEQPYDYLRNSEYELGYFINFSAPTLYIRRIIFTNDRKPWLKLLVALSLILVAFRVPASQATEFTSSNFKVLDPILHIFGGFSTSTSYRQFEAGSQAAIGISTSSSFIVKGGFLYFPGPATPAPPPAASPSPAPGTGGALPPLGSPVVVPPPAPTPTVAPFRPPRKPSPRVLPPEIDLNRDGYVDLIDVSIMLFWWHKPITPEDVAAVLAAGQFPPDPNGDGTANILDLSILLYYWTG